MAVAQFQPAVRFPKVLREPLCFAVAGQCLAARDDSSPWQPFSPAALRDMGIEAQQEHYLGRLGRRDCIAWALSPDVLLPPDLRLCHLYELLLRTDESTLAAAGRGVQIVAWDRDHRHCGRCGGATQSLVDTLGEPARHCAACAVRFYPRLAPCIIVLVSRGDELLLARGRNHPQDLYSTLAGFVEVGETVEAAVHREIREEVGLEVQNLRYFGSQPWPFPHQLMLGFFAEYKDGELKPNPAEIAAVDWWRCDNLPQVPGEYSIAGRLIQTRLQELGQVSGATRQRF